jgi:hypothetical protein
MAFKSNQIVGIKCQKIKLIKFEALNRIVGGGDLKVLLVQPDQRLEPRDVHPVRSTSISASGESGS